MTDHEKQNKNKALHQLMEDEFQQLVDIIEEKKIIHESISLTESPDSDPFLGVAVRLQEQSEELGAESLAEFFYTLEGSARSGDLKETAELIQDIKNEFESVKRLLDEN
jgi:hypothetical protein